MADLDLTVMKIGDAATATTILSIPADVLHIIFSQLSSSELARSLCVCKTWRSMGAAPLLWEKLYHERWRHGSPLPEWEELKRSGRWHELFLARAAVGIRYCGQFIWRGPQDLASPHIISISPLAGRCPGVPPPAPAAMALALV